MLTLLKTEHLNSFVTVLKIKCKHWHDNPQGSYVWGRYFFNNGFIVLIFVLLKMAVKHIENYFLWTRNYLQFDHASIDNMKQLVNIMNLLEKHLRYCHGQWILMNCVCQSSSNTPWPLLSMYVWLINFINVGVNRQQWKRLVVTELLFLELFSSNWDEFVKDVFDKKCDKNLTIEQYKSGPME